MKLNKIKKLYVNISKNIYPNDYINLAKIRDEKIYFDEKTLFLSEREKTKLNQDEIKRFEDAVVIFKLEDSWGILCNIPIKLYKEKKILSHELVLSDVIQRMLSNFHAYNSEANPVMLMHNEKLELENFVKENKEKYFLEKERIKLYIYTKKEAEKILNILKEVKKYYIADGHHRFYSTSLYEEKKEILSCIYEINQLKIETIPRKICGIKEEEFKVFKEKILKEFIVTKNSVNLKKGEVRITFQKEKFSFILKEVEGDRFDNNDIYRVNTQVISNIFRIFKDERIKYLSEKELIQELKEPLKETIYIEIARMAENEFLDAVDNNKIMPPKSTYFKPKFPSFLVFNYFRND